MSGLEFLFAAPLIGGEVLAPAAMTAAAATTAGATASTAAFLAAPMVTPTLLTAGSALSVLTAGGQLLSGISERMSVAAQRRAEAKMIEDQTRRAALQKFQEGVVTTEKGRAIAAGSGLDISGGNPLSQVIDNISTASKNANLIYNEGRTQAYARRAEAGQYDNPLALAGEGFSILSQFAKRRYS
jgi:hypothetical protein